MAFTYHSPCYIFLVQKSTVPVEIMSSTAGAEAGQMQNISKCRSELNKKYDNKTVSKLD
jgi:hypothetical protein